jgi:hypothetical protein
MEVETTAIVGPLHLYALLSRAWMPEMTRPANNINTDQPSRVSGSAIGQSADPPWHRTQPFWDGISKGQQKTLTLTL